MEEVSISEIEKQADVLEENDLLLISQYDKTSGTFDSAKIQGKNLKQKLPGLMVRMWNCHNAQLEKPYEGRDVINNLTYKDDQFTWFESRSGTRNEVICEAATPPLATNGALMLYKRMMTSDRYFHDWYNNTDFWFYAGSFDKPAYYNYVFEINRTISGREEYHKYTIKTSELDEATVYDLKVEINDREVDDISEFVITHSPDKLSFRVKITDMSNPDYEYYKDGVYFDDVYFEGFNKSSSPVSPAVSISDSDIPDEKVVVYQGKIKLEKNKSVKFKGHVDNFCSIIINGITLCDFLGYAEKEINTEFTSRDDKLYYDFKLVIANYGTKGPGFENDFPDYSDLKMSVDNGVTWINISNEEFDSDKQFFFLPNNCDDYFRSAEELRSKVVTHKPGMLIKMWHSGYATGSKSKSCIFDHEVIDKLEARDYRIPGAIDISGVKYNMTTYQDLDVTSGCGMLYWGTRRYEPPYFDWFNGKTWNYYAGSTVSETSDIRYNPDPIDKKIVAYFAEIYLAKNQSIYFKGHVDDSVSVIIDGEYPLSDDADELPLKGIHYSTEDAFRTFKFTADYTGYHPIKIIACNCATTAGPKAEATNPEFSETLKISFDNINWFKIDNEGPTGNLFFIPSDSRYDEIFENALLNRDNVKKPLYPGMLIRMWKCKMPYDAFMSNNFNSDLIDKVTPNIASIANALSYGGIDYTLTASNQLNVTSGCGLLYTTQLVDDPDYFDWFNASNWRIASQAAVEGTTHDEILVAYFTKFYLHSGQTVCFKGIPDDTLSILINDKYPVNNEGNELKYISCIDPTANARSSDPNIYYRYTATADGYHNLKIVSTNKGGPGGLHSTYPLSISFDGGTTWEKITNDDKTNPLYFIPDDNDNYIRLWKNAAIERDKYAITSGNGYPNMSVASKITVSTSGTTHDYTATANGTMMVCVGGIAPTDRTFVSLSVKIPGSSSFIEISKFTPCHYGWDTSCQNISIYFPLRVKKGTVIRISPLSTLSYDNVQMFKDC